ncbi:MAG: SDR family oxidoreductase [Clostridia bacterium]|nr:SDR family oxidoreductase [Clostridia bacterium]
MNFNGKVVVITGASHGIGLATLKKFWELGAWVVNIDKNDEIFGSDLFFKGDVADEAFLTECVKKTLEKYGNIDFLINNVSESRNGLLSGCSLEDFLHAQRVSVGTPYLLTKLFMNNFNEGGAIVNIASTRAFMSQRDTESYSAAKGAVVSLTHAMAMSLEEKGIRVNCISPGWIDTFDNTFEGADNYQHAVNRVGVPDDIANMVAYLCSDMSSFITGQNFTVDGGMTKKMIYHNDEGWVLNK